MKLASLFEHKILNESFKDAKRVFSDQADPVVVDFYLNKFKELSAKNLIKGENKDITRWFKQGFQKFKDFVQNAAQERSNKDIKRDTKLSGAIKVADYPQWTVIAPLTKEASCEYGSETKWCTAAKNDNKFDQYFHNNDVDLFYIISKSNNREKYAVAYDREMGVIEDIFDSSNNSISIEALESKTMDVESEVSKWSSKIKGKMPSLDAVIDKADPETALNLYVKHLDTLTKEQLTKLKTIIAKNADILIEYCRHFNENNDDLYVKAPKIFLTHMSKSIANFNSILPYLEDYMDTLNSRNSFIETNLAALINKFNLNNDNNVSRVVKHYVFKFGRNNQKALYDVFFNSN